VTDPRTPGTPGRARPTDLHANGVQPATGGFGGYVTGAATSVDDRRPHWAATATAPMTGTTGTPHRRCPALRRLTPSRRPGRLHEVHRRARRHAPAGAISRVREVTSSPPTMSAQGCRSRADGRQRGEQHDADPADHAGDPEHDLRGDRLAGAPFHVLELTVDACRRAHAAQHAVEHADGPSHTTKQPPPRAQENFSVAMVDPAAG